ncbi:hypothetical protein CVT24_012938, partial [Panaeolus cyanescens]
FRQQVNTTHVNELQYEQDHHDWLGEIFGCYQNEPGVQDIGSVETREGRLLTFPNILQHQVAPFKLSDSTKPGHRKILALFLVDPNIKVISTAHVPCQRKDWWKEEALKKQVSPIGAVGLGQLPVELQTQIFDDVEGFPLDMKEAKELRLELMQERKAYVAAQDSSFQFNEITSYINNLHPDERDIYRVIEKIIDASNPLWDLTLSPLQAQYPRFPPRRVLFEGCEYDPDPENGPETEGPQQLPDEDDEEFWDRRQEWIESIRRVVRPEPGDFKPRETPSLNIREKYGKTGLQIIIKFANIVLTPEKPFYGGGSWHVEGRLNEHIVATSLYYYSSENITPSSLNFRQQSNVDDAHNMDYEQEHHDWLEVIFGCENEEPGVQEIGGVDTREGRLLTFPNILQHRVGAFKLADPTKPGHRKILALFLVDPNIKIISTAHVPCQRKDWWKEVALEQESTGLGQLPVELQNHIFDEVEGFPLGMDEAQALRLELMEERKAYVQVQDATFQQYTFSLCEH